VAAGVKVEQADVHVEGMDCEACAVHLRRVLSKVGGFHDLHLDLATKTVSVTYEPAPGRLDAYVQAINELGYEASLPQKVKTAP
jgi:Cu+-exporting ATPase